MPKPPGCFARVLLMPLNFVSERVDRALTPILLKVLNSTDEFGKPVNNKKNRG